MTTSGITDWALTARDIIDAAAKHARILKEGEYLSAERAADSLVALNGLLKSWETRGYTLWRQNTAAVSITGGVNPTTLDSDVYDVEAVRFVTSATNERPLTVWDRDQYKILPNKAQTGNPSIYYIDRQRDTVNLNIWPVPADNCTVNVDYLRKIETVTDLTETVDIPQDWQETVYVLLGVRLCAMFGQEVPGELAARSQILQAEVDAQDRPASYFMGPFHN